MKIIYSFLTAVILACLAVFVLQNWALTEIKFVSWNIVIPTSFISIGFYILGALTGSMLIGLLKKGLKKDSKLIKDDNE